MSTNIQLLILTVPLQYLQRPLLFLLTSKWLIYKVESYDDELQNLKSCTFSLRSSSPLNEKADKRVRIPDRFN